MLSNQFRQRSNNLSRQQVEGSNERFLAGLIARINSNQLAHQYNSAQIESILSSLTGGIVDGGNIYISTIQPKPKSASIGDVWINIGTTPSIMVFADVGMGPDWVSISSTINEENINTYISDYLQTTGIDCESWNE
jgi:hypothetical protein